jgi:F-type H+-transporting ATPase subunit b
MNLNATIFAQMLIFAVVVWVTMKFLWPMITDPIEQRQKRIADGLAAADRGQKDLAAAESRVEELVKAARVRAQQIEGAAQKQANELIEGQRLLGAAQAQVALETQKARDELRKQVAALAVAGAGKLIDKEIDAAKHSELLDKLIAQI